MCLKKSVFVVKSSNLYIYYTIENSLLPHEYRVGNVLLLGHCPLGLEVTLILKATEATFHPSPGAPRPV